MTTLAIEMPSGIAGDMLLAALIDAGAKSERIAAQLAQLGVGPLPLRCQEVHKRGLRALQLHVDVPQEALWRQFPHGADEPQEHSHDHHDHHAGSGHRPYHAIRHLLEHAPLDERVRQRAGRVFRILAEAEAAVHGMAVDQVVFHEVGGLDAIADVVGCCIALEELGVDRVCVGPLLLGQGHVHCAHGRMPVPVPAVQEMIRGRAISTQRVDFASGELTTPTGCALAIGLADSFTLPSGSNVANGVGAGHRDIPGLPGIIRVSLWQEEQEQQETHPRWNGSVHELRAVIDDTTPQDLAAVCNALRAAGARDVWQQTITMKKGRQGSELVVLAADQDCDRLAAMMLSHTPSIGVRRSTWQRWELPRRQIAVTVQGHRIHGKVATLPDGSMRVSIEHDDLVSAAQALGKSVQGIRQQVQAALEDEAQATQQDGEPHASGGQVGTRKI